MFITEDDEIIVFDDIKKQIVTNNGVENFEDSPSPIHNALNYFFNDSSFDDNKIITIKVTKNLENPLLIIWVVNGPQLEIPS